jgi:trans-feruloyl-CoA hydratase/vanillin synthase
VAKAIIGEMDFRQALYYSMTGEQFGGKRSVEIGFTTMSVPLAQLAERTLQVANNLKGKDRHALKACKEAFKGIDIRNTSYEDARYWLKARLMQMTYEQKNTNWIDHGISKFMSKEYQPGRGAAPKAKG